MWLHVVSYFTILFEFKMNKEVLLRQRKKHTDRGVSSTPSVVLYLGGGRVLQPGYPGVSSLRQG